MKNAQAGLEGDLDQATKDHKGATGELLALGEYIAQLHGSCDFLLENFDVRREARSGEIDAIKKAKAVLSGADYSFVQVAWSIELGVKARAFQPRRRQSMDVLRCRRIMKEATRIAVHDSAPRR